jgi:hypothetical protein
VAIDWFGEQYQNILAKERCVTPGCPPYGRAVAINSMTGQFYWLAPARRWVPN